MKTILIEEVANGWIVRNYELYAVTECKSMDIHVYQSIEDLQAALPELLAPIKDLASLNPLKPNPSAKDERLVS